MSRNKNHRYQTRVAVVGRPSVTTSVAQVSAPMLVTCARVRRRADSIDAWREANRWYSAQETGSHLTNVTPRTLPSSIARAVIAACTDSISTAALAHSCNQEGPQTAKLTCAAVISTPAIAASFLADATRESLDVGTRLKSNNGISGRAVVAAKAVSQRAR
jgi:hypothetical protein